MNRYLSILACAMLVACGGSKDDPAGDSGATGDDDDDGCQTILDFFPDDGASGVYYRTAIEFKIDGPDGDETITVDGVTGSTTIDGDRVIFTSDAPLASDTTYTVTLDWCGGPTTTTWTTGAVGESVEDASVLGHTYALDLGTGRFVTPDGIGPLIQQQLDQAILVGVTDITGEDLQMMGALGLANNEQDLCSPSIDFPVAADFSENPFFVIGPDAITLDIEGVSINIEDMMISGAFAPDGSYIDGATLAGAIDTRPLAGLVGATGDDNAICELVVTFGVTCQACPDGTDYCLEVFVDSMIAEDVPGVTLVPVTQAEADACN